MAPVKLTRKRIHVDDMTNMVVVRRELTDLGKIIVIGAGTILITGAGLLLTWGITRWIT